MINKNIIFFLAKHSQNISIEGFRISYYEEKLRSVQNVNAYNYDNKKLSDLLFVLEKISGLQRIRYTTSHPKDLTQDLIEAHKDCKKLMPILHLPVQSGSSKILKLMNRNHTIEEYLELIEKLNPEWKDLYEYICL